MLPIRQPPPEAEIQNHNQQSAEETFECLGEAVAFCAAVVAGVEGLETAVQFLQPAFLVIVLVAPAAQK